MAGSEAEERIRAKAEAMLRRNWPDARIIHELMMEQGGCRLDLAAVTTDLIALVEIKSERDVLHRLPDQIRAAVKVSKSVYIATAERHIEKIQVLDEPWVKGDGPHGNVKNPAYVKEFCQCILMREVEDDLVPQYQYRYQNPSRVLHSYDYLNMLWADELRRVCYDSGVGQKATRGFCIARACEVLSGQEVRRRVCRELRSRPFPRADPPISAVPKSESNGAQQGVLTCQI